MRPHRTAGTGRSSEAGGLLLKGWEPDRALFFADENGGENAAQQFGLDSGPAALLTGPEGGFDEAERAAIRALPQARAITLGPRILRGETAAIAATALVDGHARRLVTSRGGFC
jgi:16S rRNA U1498 N3-methylase RsmE